MKTIEELEQEVVKEDQEIYKLAFELFCKKEIRRWNENRNELDKKMRRLNDKRQQELNAVALKERFENGTTLESRFAIREYWYNEAKEELSKNKS